MTMRAFLLAGLLAAARVACAHLGPHPEAGIDFEQHPGVALPLEATFVDGDGRRETLRGALDGQPGIVVLGYLGCKDLCALTVPGIAEALDGAGLVAGRDYRAVFVDIDAREGPSRLHEGPARVRDRDRLGWRFLGGDEASAHAVADRVGFRYRYEPDRDAFAHPAGFVVTTPDGRISRYFFGVRYPPAELRAAIEAARGGTFATLVEPLRLLCYHFDPVTGRHSLAILQGLRAIVAAAAIALLAAWWVRRPRRKAPA